MDKIQEAYKLVDQICASVSLSREAHIRVQQALDIIKEEIEKKDEPKQTKTG